MTISIAVQVQFDRLTLVVKFEKGRLANRLPDNDRGEICHKKFTVDRQIKIYIFSLALL